MQVQSSIEHALRVNISDYLNSGPRPNVSPTLMKNMGHRRTVMVQKPKIPKKMKTVKVSNYDVRKN